MPARPILAAAVLAATLVGVAACDAQVPPPVTLKVGDPAPPLAVGKWVKGEPVKIEPGRVYVLDFWATWCPTCHLAIPALTELAKKYPDLVVIGQNVDGPRGGDDKITRYLEQYGEAMNYRIATDDASKDPNGAMAMSWMFAAGENALPVAMIVGKDAKIAWVGHPINEYGDPAQFKSIVDRVVAGTFDAKAEAAATKKLEDLNAQLKSAARELRADDAIKASSELMKLRPENVEQLTLFEYGVLVRAGRFDEARTRVTKLIDTAKDPLSLNLIAWSTASRKTPVAEDLKLARTAVDKAVTMTGGKQADVLDSSARLYAAEKNWAKAVETQKQAIAVADADVKAELQTSLEAYEKQTLPAAN